MNLGYKDPSIRAVVPVTVNLQPTVTLLGVLVQYLSSNSPAIEDAVLLEVPTDFDSPMITIQALQLPGFNDQTWIALSENSYSKTAEYNNSHQSIRPYEVLFRYMIQFLPKFETLTLDNALLVGDFEELTNPVGVLTAGALWPLFHLDWKGLSTDPYSRTAFNFQLANQDPNSQVISPLHPVYDEYCGKKWYCGADGTGLLTDANLTWLIKQTSLKSIVTIGDLSRNSYLDDGLSTIDLYYRLCLATVAGCRKGSVSSLKISLPVNRALYGIYCLFSLFFERVELISLKHWSPDDDTCYLIGVGCLEEMPAAFMDFALRPQARNKILTYLTRDYKSLGDALTRALSSTIEKWINEVASDWGIRNAL